MIKMQSMTGSMRKEVVCIQFDSTPFGRPSNKRISTEYLNPYITHIHQKKTVPCPTHIYARTIQEQQERGTSKFIYISLKNWKGEVTQNLAGSHHQSKRKSSLNPTTRCDQTVQIGSSYLTISERTLQPTHAYI